MAEIESDGPSASSIRGAVVRRPAARGPQCPGHVRVQPRARARRRRRRPRRPSRRGARARRRVGVRQDDADPLDPRPRADVGRHRRVRRFAGLAAGVVVAGAPAPRADDLPGPVGCAEPASHDLRGGRRGDPHPQGAGRRADARGRRRWRGPACARRRGTCSATRTRCPAGSASGCSSPGRWRSGRSCCWPTSRSRRSTRRSAARSWR